MPGGFLFGRGALKKAAEGKKAETAPKVANPAYSPGTLAKMAEENAGRKLNQQPKGKPMLGGAVKK